MVLVLADHADGSIADETAQALTLARDVANAAATQLDVIAFGQTADPVLETFGSYGVDTVYTVDEAVRTPYGPVAWAMAVGTVLDGTDASLVVGAGNDRHHEVLAHVAADRSIPMAANCISVTPGDPATVRRQRWGGSLLEDARVSTNPWICTVAPHEIEAAPADHPTTPDVDSVSPPIENSLETLVRVARYESADVEGVPLGEARVVVGGGRGVGGPDGYAPLEELADLLGGTVGASRAAVNEGWRPHDDQIGLTGTKISAELYIACGISGAVQHMVGCKGAKHILAINTDPEAAIVQKADWAIIGDLHEVVPAIVSAIRETR